MSADYRIRRIRNIIKKYDRKEAANIGDLATALDAIRVEVEIYEHIKLRMEKEMIK